MPSENLSKWPLRFSLFCLALMMVVPLLLAHHRNPLPTFYQESLTAWLGLLALTFLLSGEVRQRIALPQITLLPIGFLVIVVLQWLFNPSVNTDRLLLFALYLIWAGFLILLGQQLILSASLDRLARWLAFALLLGGLLQCLLSALQVAGTPGLPWVAPYTGTLTGNLAQPNSFANYLWLGLASTLYLRSTRQLNFYIAMAATLLLIVFSLLSGSRSIWLYSPALLALAGLALWRQPRDTQLRSLFLWSCLTPIILLLSQGLFSSGLIPLPDDHITTSGAKLLQNGGSDPIRMALWKTALSIFADHPVLGGGIGQFTWQFHQHVLELMPMRLPGLPEHAHNLFLHLLAEMGLGAVLLLLVLGGHWLISFCRITWQASHWWLAALLLLLLVHSGLEYPLWYSFFLGPFALLLGAGSLKSLKLSLSRMFTPILLGALLLGCLTLITLQDDYAILEATINHQFTAENRADFQQKYAERLQKIGNASLLSPYVFMVAGNLQEDNAEELDHKRKVCQHALRFAATRQIVYKCAHIEALAGHSAEAQLALQRALAAYPAHAPVVQQEWQERQAKEPSLRPLLAEFPPAVSATRTGAP